MTDEEYIKELKYLYEQAKSKGETETAFNILGTLKHEGIDDPCGVDNFRKQAEE